MITIDPKETPQPKFHSYLLGAVAPRPIAFASTMDRQGNVNLSPFSFFNCFGSNPPVLVFSPSRRGRDKTHKHTYENVKEVPEVVIHIVTYDIVEQASLTSCDFPKGVNEFVKAGFTPVPSVKVRPPRVGESPVAMECKVLNVVELGDGGGSGNLVICEVLLMHIKEEILDASGRIDPVKLDAVARMGGDNYLRAMPPNIFTVPKPNEKIGIGFDQLPPGIRESTVLTGNDLARLANVEAIPVQTVVPSGEEFEKARSGGKDGIHQLARKYLREGNVTGAWAVLLSGS